MDETGAVPGSGHPNGRGADSPPVVELGRLRLLERAINTSHDGVLITDARLPDNPVIFANPAFEVLTGYAMAEVVGRNCRFLQCAETDPEQNPVSRLPCGSRPACRPLPTRLSFWPTYVCPKRRYLARRGNVILTLPYLARGDSSVGLEGKAHGAEAVWT